MHMKISPSMMCADIAAHEEILAAFEQAGIEYLHIDVMDGQFVPNFQLGTAYIGQLRKLTRIPLDIHLMVEKPEDKLEWLDIAPGEYVAIHYEATRHPHRVLTRIRDLGGKPMLVLNPGTPIVVLEDIIDAADAVLVMTVNPGFAGQALVEGTLSKIRRLRDWLDATGRSHVEIEVDGNVSFANAERMAKAGANLFVAGTSSVFHKDYTLPQGIQKLRDVLAGAAE